ncbi:MAG: hypothetical protein JWM48_2934 [Mycobacterium sp.]|nr:hypothetical protein [Mycobacterium sp.]
MSSDAGQAAAPGPREMIDWDLAVATGRRLAKAGPTTSRGEAAAAVLQLRSLADVAAHHVEGYTGLLPAVATAVAVIDRGEWMRSNAASLREISAPLVAKLAERRRGAGRGLTDAVGRRVTGLQVGLLLAFLSDKVLGQYEVFLPAGEGEGRLALVAPNIVEAERRLGVDPTDFRLWVCLHEQTHRSQFTAVPWMKTHLRGLIDEFVADSQLDASQVLARLKDAVATARELRDPDRPDSGTPAILAVLQTPRQRDAVARIQALMTLLEGHAEHVMDAVGPSVVPSVADIREKFDARRSGGSPLDKVLRRLLGLEAKMRQYRDGAGFVNAVVAAVGVAGFNRVWTSPETLPTPAEIRDPQVWVARVHGTPAAG